MQTARVRPFLRWAGSKRQLLLRLGSFWSDEYSRYVEPFMGSACLFFALNPRNALLGDLNGELVQSFMAVRDHPTAVWHRLSRMRLGRRAYYQVRGADVAKLNEIDRAARLIYLNRFCFNGLYRTNAQGEFNVPHSAARTGDLPTLKELKQNSERLRNAEIHHTDFEETLSKTVEGDFVYMDPPYAVGNRRIFRQYGPDSFGIEDLRRLSASLKEIHSRNVRFVLTYAYCKEALDMLRGWDMMRVYSHRNIAGFAKHRRRAAELIVSNCTPARSGCSATMTE